MHTKCTQQQQQPRIQTQIWRKQQSAAAAHQWLTDYCTQNWQNIYIFVATINLKQCQSSSSTFACSPRSSSSCVCRVPTVERTRKILRVAHTEHVENWRQKIRRDTKCESNSGMRNAMLFFVLFYLSLSPSLSLFPAAPCAVWDMK